MGFPMITLALRCSSVHAAYGDQFDEASRHLHNVGRMDQSSLELSLAKLCKIAHAKEDATAMTIDSEQTRLWLANIDREICAAKVCGLLGLRKGQEEREGEGNAAPASP